MLATVNQTSTNQRPLNSHVTNRNDGESWLIVVLHREDEYEHVVHANDGLLFQEHLLVVSDHHVICCQ